MPRIITAGRDLAFSPAAELDFLMPIQSDIPGWSENMFFQFWDDDQAIGFFTHIGRVRENPAIWRNCLAVYLPDGRVLVQRTHGRAAGHEGPQAGSMRIVCAEPGTAWHLTYDGVAEATTSAVLSRRLAGAGTARPLTMDFHFRSSSPTYDLFAARGLEHEDFAHLHHEQAFDCSGEIGFDGHTYHLRGFGFRDHSLGARDLSSFGGNAMFYASFPSGRVIQALQNFMPDGTVRLRSGFIVEHGHGELLDLVEAPGLTSTAGAPERFAIHYLRDGAPIAVNGLALHAATFTIGMPNDWSIGTDTQAADPLIIVEQPCRVQWPDGEVGFGNLERNFRRNALLIGKTGD